MRFRRLDIAAPITLVGGWSPATIRIGHVAIYPRALAAEQIQNHYRQYTQGLK